MLRQRVTGDYLQTSAILDRQFEVVSAVNDINDYQGPGTGYRISPAIFSICCASGSPAITCRPRPFSIGSSRW
ncbi:hypothetical protein CKQ90_33960 [Klebsiella pneumoniae]|nr:hypothetical protein CKQ90_33960 [Klebsiella pneumoniae]